MNNNSIFGTSVSEPTPGGGSQSPIRLLNFDTQTGVGVDKLHLHYQDFIVPDSRRLNLETYGRKANEPEAKQDILSVDKSTGEYIEGKKAYFNGEGYQLTINKHGLQIITNPAKITNPQTPYIMPTDPGEIHDKYMIIAKRIEADTGVLFKPMEGNVCRLDLAKQYYMERPVSDYLPAFELCKLKHSRHNVRRYGNQTYQYNSASSPHQFIFYDKLSELCSEMKPHPDTTGSQYLRGEMRLLRSQAVRDLTKTGGSLESVLNGGKTLFLNVYDTYLRTRLLHGNYQEKITFNVQGLRELFEEVEGIRAEKSTGKGKQIRGVVDMVMKSIGTRTIVDDIGLETFISVCSDYVSPRHLSNIRQDIIHQARLSSRLYHEISTIELLDEITNKFLNRAS